MTVVVLGASGGTGRELVAQALARGLQVRALVRNPEAAAFAAHPLLDVVRADVHRAEQIADSVGPGDVLVSGLGVARRSEAGTLTAGATAVVNAHPARIVWLGAMGTGASQPAVSAPIGWMLRTGFGPEYGDKVAADEAVLAAGGVVVHSGPLSDKPDDQAVALAPLSTMPRQFFPAGASRAGIARLMLDIATGTLFEPGLLAVRPR
ncbi:NAD(P)-dependent oxidoreductase [Glaciihabitans arcticus]|nr:NAD(P)-binding oxidoreductase [Glaciihabitans arcticus]